MPNPDICYQFDQLYFVQCNILIVANGYSKIVNTFTLLQAAVAREIIKTVFKNCIFIYCDTSNSTNIIFNRKIVHLVPIIETKHESPISIDQPIIKCNLLKFRNVAVVMPNKNRFNSPIHLSSLKM